MPTKLNHHAASVLPYHLSDDGQLHLLFEVKDPGFRPPFFDNGFNFLGGNWTKGKDPDRSPEELLKRELHEEFYLREESPETVSEILRQEWAADDNLKNYSSPSPDQIRRIQEVPRIILGPDGKAVSHAADYINTFNPPMLKEPMVHGYTAFTRELNAEELANLTTIIAESNGILTTDNHAWGSSVGIFTVDEINERNLKFAWGYEHIVNDLMDKGAIPKTEYGIVRTLAPRFRGLSDLEYDADLMERGPLGAPTFAGIESAGYEYAGKS